MLQLRIDFEYSYRYKKSSPDDPPPPLFEYDADHTIINMTDEDAKLLIETAKKKDRLEEELKDLVVKSYDNIKNRNTVRMSEFNIYIKKWLITDSSINS